MAFFSEYSTLFKCTLTFLIVTALMKNVTGTQSSNIQSSGYLSQLTQRRPDTSISRGLEKVRSRLEHGKPSPEPSAVKQQAPISNGDQKYRSTSRIQDSFVKPEQQRSSLSDLKELDGLEDGDDLDDEDSYEDEEDETTGNNDVLADRITSWGHQYKSRYLASKTSTSTTTTTTTTTTTPSPTPAPMSYSQYKWQNLGSRQAVEQSRRLLTSSSGSNSPLASNSGSSSTYNNNNYPSHGSSYGNHNQQNSRHNAHHNRNGQYHHHHHQRNSNQQQHGNNRAQPQTPDTAVREAISHALKVSKEGSCKVPSPRVIRVQDFYPHPGKTYVPHCTILHQCSDDVGCCRHDVLTCSPKSTVKVELSFYTINVENNRGSTVERLEFYNHTECECRDKMDELMPRDVPYPDSSSYKSGQSSFLNSLDPITSSSTNSNRQISVGNHYDHPKLKHSPRCKCPSAFTQRLVSDGSCSCDCFDKQHDCLRQKRGKDFFTMQDKWCIQSGRCEVPGCTYGSYIHLAGRCPRKKEREGHSWHRYLTQQM